MGEYLLLAETFQKIPVVKALLDMGFRVLMGGKRSGILPEFWVECYRNRCRKVAACGFRFILLR
jgi:hypothetical protein